MFETSHLNRFEDDELTDSQTPSRFCSRWHHSARKDPYVLCPVRSLIKVALETFPLLVWLNTDCSRPLRVERRPLTFSSPPSLSRKTGRQNRQLWQYHKLLTDWDWGQDPGVICASRGKGKGGGGGGGEIEPINNNNNNNSSRSNNHQTNKNKLTKKWVDGFLHLRWRVLELFLLAA